MRPMSCFLNAGALFGAVILLATQAFGDEKFDQMIAEGKYKDAIAYADKQLPAAQRTVDVWLALAVAEEKSGGTREEILACYKGAQMANPSEPKVYSGFGEYYLRDKKWAEALESFQKSYLLKRAGRAAEGIAIAASQLNQWDKALDAAESAVHLDSTVFDARLILAEIYVKQNDYKSAAEQLQFIVQKRPGDVKYWLRLASCYEKTNNTDKLAEVDPKIVELDKKNVPSRRRMVERSLLAKDTSAALTLCKELAVLTPDDPKVFKYLYQISIAQNQKKDAVLYLRNYLALDSSSAASFKTLGDLMYEQKDADGAADAYRKAIRIDPQIKGLYRNYVDIALRRNQENEIVAAVKGAIAAGEADSRAYVALGDIMKKRKDYAAAVRLYQDALKTEPGNVAVLTSMAECQALNNEVANAMVTYEQVVMLNPNATKEFKELGDLQAKSGKAESAMASYKKYLAKAPGDGEVSRKIGLHEFGRKQHQECIKYLEMVKDANLQDVEYFAALGESYYATGDHRKAAEAIAKARGGKPPAAVLQRILKLQADSYEKIGDESRAAEAYDAYTQMPGVRDPDASYKKAFFREKTDRVGAARMYEANTALFPKDHRNFLRLGLIYAEDKATLDKAAVALTSASVLVDTIPAVWENLAVVSGKLGNEEKELAAYKKLLVSDPQDLNANKRVGTILMKRGQVQQAVANLAIVTTVDPKDIDATLMLADGYIKLKRKDEAVSALRNAKALKPDDVAIRLSLIKIEEELGMKDALAKERADLAELDRKIIAKDKKNVESRLRLAEYSMSVNDSAQALVLCKELAILTPHDAKIFKYLFQLSQSLNDRKSATLYLKNYLVLDSTSASSFAMLGDLLYEQKDVDGAAEAYRKALKTDPAIKGVYRNYVQIALQRGQENEILTVIKGAIAAGEADSKAYFALADIMRKRKDYAAAVKYYQDGLKGEPGNVAMLTSLADCQARNGETNNAIVSYEQVVMLNTAATKEYKELGDLQMKAGKTESAVASYKKYLAKVPADNEVARKIGLYDHGRKQWQEAIKSLEMVKEPSLQDVDYFAALGECYYNTGDYKRAAETFAKARALKPTAAVQEKILRLQAESYEKIGDDLKAAEAYEAYTGLAGVRDADASYKKGYLREKSDKTAATKIYAANTVSFPKDYRNFLRLGMIYSEDKATYDKAAAALASASQIVDTIPAVWQKLGELNGKLGNEERELAAYKKLLTTDPQNLVANKRVGVILLKKGQSQQAMANLEIALTLDPGDVEVMLLLAGEYAKTKRPQQSIDLLTKAKTKRPDDIGIRMKLYELMKQANQDEKASNELLGVIEITKDNKYRLMYVREMIERKQYDAAKKIVDEIKAKDPENIETLMLLASIQKSQGKYDDAIETYKEVSYVKGFYAPALYERGDVYMLQGKPDKAQEYFEKALQADPKYGLAEYGLAKIAKAKGNSAEYQKRLARAAALEPGNKQIAEEAAKLKK